MVEFVDSSIEDLVSSTMFVHYVKPSLKNKMVVRIEKPKPEDRSIVFRMYSKGDVEEELFVLSADYILDHPFWNDSDK